MTQLSSAQIRCNWKVLYNANFFNSAKPICLNHPDIKSYKHGNVAT